MSWSDTLSFLWDRILKYGFPPLPQHSSKLKAEPVQDAQLLAPFITCTPTPYTNFVNKFLQMASFSVR